VIRIFSLLKKQLKMPEKDDKYFDAKAEAKALEAKVDALQATIVGLKKKKAAGKLDAIEQVDLVEGEKKLAELEAKEAEYIQIAKEAVMAGSYKSLIMF
jgi:hypothetical protein